MQQLRIEYPSLTAPAERLSFPVPDMNAARAVAHIVCPEGDVELWDGDQQVTVLHNHDGDLAPLLQLV